jgi:hypothetical protein
MTKPPTPTKAELHEMQAEAVRNTQPQPVHNTQPKPVRRRATRTDPQRATGAEAQYATRAEAQNATSQHTTCAEARGQDQKSSRLTRDDKLPNEVMVTCHIWRMR